MRAADGLPVLVDFGSARHEGAERLTDRMPPGTREYRSPEQLRFARTWVGDHYPSTALDDLWALGVTLYGLLTRELPFGDRGGPLVQRILEQPPVPVHELNPRVPRALGELCLRLLEKDPSARYPARSPSRKRSPRSWSGPMTPGTCPCGPRPLRRPLRIRRWAPRLGLPRTRPRPTHGAVRSFCRWTVEWAVGNYFSPGGALSIIDR